MSIQLFKGKSTGPTGLKDTVIDIESKLKTAGVSTHMSGINVASLESYSEGSTQFNSVAELATQLDQELVTAFGVESICDDVDEFSKMPKVTLAQRKAAVMVAMASADPVSFAKAGLLSAKKVSAEGVQELVQPTFNGVGGNMDYMMDAHVGLEAFNESELRQHIPFSIAFNFQAARQDDFSEAFYPTLVVTPDQAGLDIGVRRGVVFNTVRHNKDGRAADFARKNLIDAFVDASILENESTYLYPEYVASGAGANTDKFVDTGLIGTRTETVENVSITTAPLKAGVSIGLIGISSNATLIENGILDHSDDVDARLALKRAYFSIGASGSEQALVFNTLKLPRSGFTKTNEGPGREVGLQFVNETMQITPDILDVAGAAVTPLAGLVSNGYTARFAIKLSGYANLEEGNVSVDQLGAVVLTELFDEDGNAISTAGGVGATIKAAIEAMTFVGYDLEARRTNANKRTRGLLVETYEYVERYTIPLGSPISTPAPIGTNRDSADMQNLITTARIRNSNNAVTQLLNYGDVLKGTVVNNYTGAVPQIEGIGRWLVKPWYEEATIDVEADINSLSSAERAEDLRALLINKIRDMAYRAYRDSRYQAALDALTGGQGAKPRLVIGTDPVIIQHLMVPGDSRTLGIGMDHMVVSTLDSRFRDKIAFSFVRTDVAGQADPLSFGLHAWIPELTSTVQMHRTGATYKETMVQPRSRHINTLPLLGMITVSNLSTGLTDRTPIEVTGLDGGAVEMTGSFETTDVTPAP